MALEQMPDWRRTPVFVWTSLLLTDDEIRQLVQTARAVLAKGGGLSAVLVERLRLWRAHQHARGRGTAVNAPAAARVLVVDDHALNLELASFVLASDGLQVSTAADADQALALVASFRPHLILMDIQMPGMDGLALTRLLKQCEATRHIVVIAFTAFAMKGDEKRMLEAGCDGYLAKPIDVGSFARQVRAWLPDGAGG